MQDSFAVINPLINTNSCVLAALFHGNKRTFVCHPTELLTELKDIYSAYDARGQGVSSCGLGQYGTSSHR